jgi:DNA-binding GntR family transcriptional regulator
MQQAAQMNYGRTAVETVADYLFEEIAALRLLPGAKISEADIAVQFGVSRQPVRDAFSRLANMDLLLIRPQRATEVRRFSSAAIEKSRYIRSAVELDVLRRAAPLCDAAGAEQLDACIAQQQLACDASDYTTFGKHDYAFHKTLCEIAGVPFAFDIIAKEKAKVDRLCLLSLAKEARMPELIEDHLQIAKMVTEGNADKAMEAGALHLSRLDVTIDTIKARNPDYFEAEA